MGRVDSTQELVKEFTGQHPNAPYGEGVWSTTKPFPHEARLAGVPRAKLQVEGGAPRSAVYALLYDVDAQGNGDLITRGAHAVTGTGTIDIELYPEDYTIKAGHRLLMVIAGSDLSWWNPPHSGQAVTIKGGQATLPFLRYERTGFLKGGVAAAMSHKNIVPFDLAELAASVVDMALPAKLVPFPAGQAPTGGEQISLAEAQRLVEASRVAALPRAAAKRGRLRVTLRRVTVRGRKMLIAFVSGATTKKIRLDLRRGTKTVAKRTLKVKRGTARATFRLRGKGRFSVLVRSTTGKKRVLARSTSLRVK
jgi:hypothetical protein